MTILTVVSPGVDVQIRDIAMALADESSHVQAEFLNCFADHLRTATGSNFQMKVQAQYIRERLSSLAEDLLKAMLPEAE